MSSVLDEITERVPEIEPFLISAALKSEPEPPIVLGLDIGTSGVRAMLFDGRGDEIESAGVQLSGDLYQALSCGSDVAEQITKKSVKLEMPARSRMTISSAFLFEASSAQVVANCFAVMSLTPGKVFPVE